MAEAQYAPAYAVLARSRSGDADLGFRYDNCSSPFRFVRQVLPRDFGHASCVKGVQGWLIPFIQPVESPVICRPYYEPTHYWEYDKNTGRARKMEGRRPASYWYKDPSADIRRGQMTLELEEDRRDLVCVNKLRADVKRWRASAWEGATNVTKDLLRHWWRKDRTRRFFFCQLEAAETIIFLNEIRGFRRDGKRGQPRWNPEFSDADYDLLWNSEGNGESLTRYATKMATGSGKTVVMSMLVAWAFCNRARVPSRRALSSCRPDYLPESHDQGAFTGSADG